MRNTTRATIGAAILFISSATQAQIQTNGLELVPRDQVPKFGTFYRAGGPAGRPLPPLPCPPKNLDVPIYALGNGHFLFDDSNVDYGTSNLAGTGAWAAEMSTMEFPLPGDGGTPDDSPAPPPNIPNCQKFIGQVFSLIDTNAAALNDTNLYNACISFPEDTNAAPMLQIARYGGSSVIIKANHFDYSAETRDFALVICDTVERPLYKNIDLAAPDAQDGWLVQGSVPNWKVTDPMYLAVSNITLTYNAFFRAIPYSGPEVQLTGAQPYETVSNIVTLQATIADLSGVTNEQFQVTVDGIPPRYSLAPSNAISIDTRYTPAGYVNVYLSAFNSARVYDPTNPPDRAKLTFSGTASLPLDFENDTYLAFGSDMCPTDVGTNYILFVINKAQQIQATIFDPSNGQTVASFAGYVPYAATVALPWNFTEADGVTPYSHDTYAVTFTGSDPATTLATTNRIDRQGVREGAGCFLTYQWEDPSDLTFVGPYLNDQAATWIGGTLQNLYGDLYWGWGLTQYTPLLVGSGRDYVNCHPRDPWSMSWESILKYALDSPLYSDLTLGPAHGNGAQIGHTDYLPGGFSPATLQVWCEGMATNSGVRPNWRLRKAALWTCYSGELGLATVPGYYITAWPDACGIRPAGMQGTSFMRKNCGLFFGGEIPQAGIGSPPASAAKVEETLDQIWVCGKYMYPGGCDPTYSFDFAINATRGMYSPQLDWADPRRFGYGYMIYSSIYDNELQMLNNSHVHSQ